MAGTKAGGIKTAITNKAKYGEDFYNRIGVAGGSVKHPGTRAFFADRELARRAGTLGGTISRRKAVVKDGK